MTYRMAMQKAVERGWVPIPLGLDARGLPKRPLPKMWQTMRREVAPKLMWGEALGMGIVLGEQSGNLAVVDIDDSAMAGAAFAYFAARWMRTKSIPRMVWTVSGNMHIYVTESKPSMSTALKVHWRGRVIGVELKAGGTQVAAPPTPKYKLVAERDPERVESIAAFWKALSEALGVEKPPDGVLPTRAGYPKPWQSYAPGERNNAAYIEACRLREARMPQDDAVEHMRIRWESHYDHIGMSWREVERTVISAYKKQDVAPEGFTLKSRSRKWQ